MIRGSATPVAELVRSGRARQLRGIGPGIEARLRELVETGEIRELKELERELAPDLVGLGRYLGLGARRSVELARALGVRTADELRGAAGARRPATRPGPLARLVRAARSGLPRHRPATAARALPRVAAGRRADRPAGAPGRRRH